jgi:negative regulator of flagellin synthesis FlgM
MKITNHVHVSNIMKSYNKTVPKAEKAGGVKFVADSIEISDAAREVQVATKALRNLPEVREELVNALKQAIQDGTYKPSSEDIAKKILGR